MFSLMLPKFLENLCMVDAQKIFVEKMSDYNMKCMETTQGSPVPVTGDLDPRMRWWSGYVPSAWWTRPVTLCDLLRDAESSLSSFRHDGHSTCISFLGLSRHVMMQ